MSARILTCSEEEYFADPCTVPSLSQSIGRMLVSECPLKAWQQHPRLGKPSDEVEESTPAQDAGKIIGKLLLGKGSEIEIIVADDFRTKVAQQARNQARALGKVPIIEHKFAALNNAAQIVLAKLAARGYVFDGESEVPVEWWEDGACGPVLCRGRMDHLKVEQATIYDLKKIVSANPETCSQHIYEYGYDIQWAAYTSALRKLRGEPDLLVDYFLLFVEVEPPYIVTDVDFNRCGEFREIGQTRWNRAVGIWERCLARGEWPEYTAGPIGVEPRPWVAQREINSGNW